MDSEQIRELFRSFGPVSIRRMFGGAGIYEGDTIFALVADGLIYLKAGPGNEADFEAEGLEPFSYEAANGKRAVMSYRRMPDRLYDDPEELAVWARRALEAARSSPVRPVKRKRKRQVRRPGFAPPEGPLPDRSRR